MQWVADTSKGSVKRVLTRNGQKLSESEQRAGIDHFTQNPSVQQKQKQDNQGDDEQAEELLKLLPAAFRWTNAGTHGSNTIMHFKPDPNFDPPDREARVFAAMEGDLAIDTHQYRIASLKGRLIHDVNFGWGLLGKLEEGGTFDVERRELAPGKWQITETHVHINGHALLFKSISENEDEVKTQWKPLPNDLSPENAGQAVDAAARLIRAFAVFATYECGQLFRALSARLEINHFPFTFANVITSVPQ